MQELFTKLGIDWRLFLAQLINFAVLLLVLYKFLYKPLLALLDRRRMRIEKSLEEATRIEAESKRLDQLKREKVEEARREAARILEETAVRSESAKQKALEKTRQESMVIVEKAREQIRQEKAELMHRVQEEAADLVVAAAEQVLKKKIDEDTDTKFINASIAELSSP